MAEDKSILYFDVRFSENGEYNQDDHTVMIKALREPKSLEELNEFLKDVVEEHGKVIEYVRLSEDEGINWFDTFGDENRPVLGEVKVLYDEKSVLDDANRTEILSVSQPFPDDEEYTAIHYVQGNLTGVQLVQNCVVADFELEVARFNEVPEIPVHREYGLAMVPVTSLNTVGHSEKEAVLELINRGELELHDLSELPNVKDLGPVLSDLYHEALSTTPEMFFLDEDNKDSILKMGQEKSVQEICESIEADLEKFPALRKVIEVDPDGPEEGEPIVTCYMDFPCMVVEDYDREKYRSAVPFMLNQAGAKILEYVQEAVDKELGVVEACKEHNITYTPRKLEEALYAFGHFSSKQVLKVLDKEAHRPDKRKDAAVLDGALKYESQHDRKEALKQVKSWMKKPCDKVAEEIEKLQEKNRQQGR